MYRCLVIDDEPLALNVLAGYIRRTDGLLLTDVTTDPVAGLRRVLAAECELVFLDIQMPKLNGIEFMKAAGDRCKIILTTAYAEFALEGYEHNVVDYLLKPISFERFSRAVNKLPVLNGQAATPDFIFVKSEYKLLRVDFEDILYLESLRDYVAIHMASGQKHLTLQTLSGFEKELPPSQFMRVHKSYIIALNKITVVEKNKVIVASAELPVGDTYRNAFRERVSRR